MLHLQTASIHLCRAFAVYLMAFGMFYYSPSVNAGQLDDFERDATGNNGRVDATVHYDSADDNDECSRMADCLRESLRESLMEAFSTSLHHIVQWVVLNGGRHSMARIQKTGLRKRNDVAYASADSSAGYYSPPTIKSRRRGEPLIPFFRLDSALQQVGDTVSSSDMRLEAGFGSVGFQLRQSRFTESRPVDHLEISQWHLLYRMSFGPHVGINLGLGQYRLSGEQNHTAMAMTIPMQYHPTRLLGFEFKPTFTSINGNQVADYDYAVLLKDKFGSLHAGYRQIQGPVENLSGPYAGIGVHW